jgi:hypothetical protein
MKLCAYQFLLLFRLIRYKRFVNSPSKRAEHLDIVIKKSAN